MMSAKEMFEELGYKQVRNDSCLIKYEQFINGNCIQITFTLLLKKVIATYGYQTGGSYAHDITSDEFRAIVQQEKELGWIEENICTNFNSDDTSDFLCSNCGICLEDLSQIVIPEGCKENIKQDEYELRYCPNCGCKIVDYEHFAKKAKYKVTQFEFDLLNTYRLCKEGCKFRDCTQLRQLKEKGYFKGIDDNEPIGDILAKSEVV